MVNIIAAHIQISIICAAGTAILLKTQGKRIRRVFPEVTERKTGQKKGSFYKMFLCPGMNVLLLIGVIYLTVISNERAEEIKMVAEIRHLK